MRDSLRFLLKYAEDKYLILLGYIVMLLECATLVASIFLQRDLIDKVFVGKNYDEFYKLLLLYAVFFFGPKLWFTIRKVIFFYVGYKLRMSLTEAFIAKVYRLRARILDKEHIGSLMTNIRVDINDACDVGINQLLSDAVFVVVNLLFLACSIAFINIKMLVIVLAIGCVYYVLLSKVSERVKAYSQNVRTTRSEVSKAMEESVSSVREIIANNRYQWLIEGYEKSYKKYYKSLLDEAFYKVKIIFVSEPFVYIAKIVVILMAAKSSLSGNASLGEFVISYMLVDQFLSSISTLFQSALSGKRLSSSVNCIKKVLLEEEVVFGDTSFEGPVESIKFEDVFFSYSDDAKPTLNGLTIDFPKNKKVAIVGESGCGKSTIVQLLLRRYAPDSGRITINDIPIHKYGDNYKDRVSAVHQNPYFLPCSIKVNLGFDKYYDLSEMEQICDEMMCKEFISGFDEELDTQVGERGAKLSGGQRQRVALSRGMLRNPDVLILDEATSALDLETEFCVQRNIDRLRSNKSTIIIAHRLSIVKDADVIYVLENGRVADFGTHEELMESSFTYRELYENQRLQIIQ